MLQKIPFYFYLLLPLIFLVAGYQFGVAHVEILAEQLKYEPRPITSVQEYGPLKIGGEFGPETNFPGPRDYPIEMSEEANFFINVVQKDLYRCMFESCGMSGALVECMGGWLSGNTLEEISDKVGLGDKWEQVLAGKASIIVVSDRNSKIVGIYPNHTTQELPRILRKHPNLTKNADFCYDYHMPR